MAWVVRQIPRGRAVVRARRLTGGISSQVYGVAVEDAIGRRHRAVLRQWRQPAAGSGSGRDPIQAVRRERGVLTALADAHLPAPRLLAADPVGQDSGAPALLMTRLPGRIDLTPDDRDGWLRQQAVMLPVIHAVVPATAMPAFESWLDLDVDVPPWSNRSALWREALTITAEPRGAAPGGFVHHDYQPFNLLWSRGQLSGVVDWGAASQGPPDVDVAHCRLNVCLLYGADQAEDFVTRYEACAGRRLDPWWAVASLVDYLSGWDAASLQRQAGRRLRIDTAELDRRVEEMLVRTMRRIAG